MKMTIKLRCLGSTKGEKRMEEKRLSVVEHFTQQMTSESQAELIKKCFYIIRNHKS